MHKEILRFAQDDSVLVAASGCAASLQWIGKRLVAPTSDIIDRKTLF